METRARTTRQGETHGVHPATWELDDSSAEPEPAAKLTFWDQYNWFLEVHKWFKFDTKRIFETREEKRDISFELNEAEMQVKQKAPYPRLRDIGFAKQLEAFISRAHALQALISDKATPTTNLWYEAINKVRGEVSKKLSSMKSVRIRCALQ